jgi:hypothetical protein
MSKQSKLLITAAVAGIVLVAIVLAKRPGKAPESTTQESAPATTEETNRSSFLIKRGRRHSSPGAVSDGSMGESSTATNSIPAWADKVDDILGSDSPDPEKARQMLEMFPQLPAEGQEEVARHVSNLLPDQDYSLVRVYLTNASLPETVLDVLFGDLLNRPNSLKLPGLLDVARTPQHPMATEARDYLVLFLEEDYADDWNRWQTKLDEWLKAHPD